VSKLDVSSGIRFGYLWLSDAGRRYRYQEIELYGNRCNRCMSVKWVPLLPAIVLLLCAGMVCRLSDVTDQGRWHQDSDHFDFNCLSIFNFFAAFSFVPIEPLSADASPFPSRLAAPQCSSPLRTLSIRRRCRFSLSHPRSSLN